jgi:AhpD family alkylhydroperoxidase
MDIEKMTASHERIAQIVDRCVAQSALSQSLCGLAHLRVSQINGCDARMDAHFLSLLGAGIAIEKLALVSDWRDAGTGLTPRERAALAWAEALLATGEARAAHAQYQEVAAVLEHDELVALSLSIALENARSQQAVAGLRGQAADTGTTNERAPT